MECSGLNEPDFEDNPSEWFDLFDDCMSREIQNPEPQNPTAPPCRPRTVHINGKCF